MYAVKWLNWVVDENISIGKIMTYLMFDCENSYIVEKWSVAIHKWETVNITAHNYDWMI